ncbi:tetratricopeptide repeat protein [Akkermansiaceae bacterium]|nr:tetratricopeptide repeat protein [Akkermansiaceae bacterium]
MDTPTANFIQIMQDRVLALRNEGNLHEALHAANAAVEKSQHALSPDLDTIDAFATSLESRAGIFLELGRHDEAIEDVEHAIDQLENRPDRIAQVGRLYALLGAAFDGQGRSEEVTRAWQAAVEYFEKHEPPLLLDVAAITNNLGFIAKASGDLDAAEDHFLKSLEIMHAELGQNHEETAAVSNNLGAVYLAAGYLDQAREMHMMALETRRELFGENHPDTAQSHNNLALALLKTGDRNWARKHFEKALAGFESLGAAYSDDLESVASNYCDFLKEEGEEQLSEIIAGRVKDLLAGF